MNRQEAAEHARKKQLEMAGGDEEELRRMRAAWGSKGGKRKVVKGFATDPEFAAKAARLGHQMRRIKKRRNV